MAEHTSETTADDTNPRSRRRPDRRVETRSLSEHLHDFFYAREVPYSLAVVRIVLPWILMIAALPRWFHIRELYSLDGAPAPMWEGFGHVDLLPVFSPTFAVAGYTLMLCCLVTMSLGWRTRTSILLAMVLYPYFGLTDALSTLTKYTVVSTHVLLLL
ncbi:MAG: hypothetical protein KDA58_11620, partial [Planctomycetaceae bacterium]|nr:hypothetical protein [Planctomycetaceae bacterium]